MGCGVQRASGAVLLRAFVQAGFPSPTAHTPSDRFAATFPSKLEKGVPRLSRVTTAAATLKRGRFRRRICNRSTTGTREHESRRDGQAALDHRPRGAAIPFPGAAGQARDHADEADGDGARPVARLFAGRRRSGQGDRRRSDDRLRLYRARQHGRRDHQRNRDPRPRQPRGAGVEAGDGRQGGAVQALRRRRFDRSRGRYPGPGRVHQRGQVSWSVVRRHQSRGHQGAGVLLHRGAPARDDGHPRLSRRSARHRHHRRRRHDERHASDGPRHSQDPNSCATARARPASPVST